MYGTPKTRLCFFTVCVEYCSKFISKKQDWVNIIVLDLSRNPEPCVGYNFPPKPVSLPCGWNISCLVALAILFIYQ